MNVKSALSVLAVSTGYAFAGPAMVQTSVDGDSACDADLPAVQERYDPLPVADTAASASTSADDSSAARDATVEDVPAVNEMANMTSTIDLDTVPVQACLDVGPMTR